MAEFIEREKAFDAVFGQFCASSDETEAALNAAIEEIRAIPAADVRPVAEIEKIIESLQGQADMYNQRAKELLVQEDGEISQYTWAVSLRETYRRIIKTLDDLIS